MGNFNQDLDSERVYKIVSKATLSSDILGNVLEHKEMSKKFYIHFIEQPLRGEKSVLEPMQKCNLKIFKSLNKVVITKVQEKVIELKEEKTLILRYLIASPKRSDLDIQFLVGNFEFSVAPKTLF